MHHTIHVTSFSSIPYCSNSENWPQNCLTLKSISLFFFGTRVVEGRIPDRGTGPYPTNNGEQNLGMLEILFTSVLLHTQTRLWVPMVSG